MTKRIIPYVKGQGAVPAKHRPKSAYDPEQRLVHKSGAARIVAILRPKDKDGAKTD